MGGGYVLDFSDRTYSEFFAVELGVDIFSEEYSQASGSKAHRLRRFFDVAPDDLLARAVAKLVQHAKSLPDVDAAAVARGEAIAARLDHEGTGAALGVLRSATDVKNHPELLGQIEAAIQAGQPQAGLDRLHTLVTDYLRSLCLKHGLDVHHPNGDAKALDSLAGEYRKFVEATGKIKQPYIRSALRNMGNTLRELNTIRNNSSLAHVNDLLDPQESLWILDDVSQSLKNLMKTEGLLGRAEPEPPVEDEEALPF